MALNMPEKLKFSRGAPGQFLFKNIFRNFQNPRAIHQASFFNTISTELTRFQQD